MKELLIDTDTLSLFLRNQLKVMSAAEQYLKFHAGFTFSVVTHFEILRGLKVKAAQKQILKFGLICAESNELNLTSGVIERAAEIYAQLYKQGNIIGDADILIAATAMENGLTVVTNNVSHFERINGLQVINWTK